MLRKWKMQEELKEKKGEKGKGGIFYIGVRVEKYMIYIYESPKKYCEGSVRNKQGQEKNSEYSLEIGSQLMESVRKLVKGSVSWMSHPSSKDIAQSHMYGESIWFSRR